MNIVGQKALKLFRTNAYENRFRDPTFLALWQRWQNARNMWDEAWWFALMGEGGSNLIYNPDPALISNPKVAAQATEFIEARKAYLAWVKSHAV